MNILETPGVLGMRICICQSRGPRVEQQEYENYFVAHGAHGAVTARHDYPLWAWVIIVFWGADHCTKIFCF